MNPLPSAPELPNLRILAVADLLLHEQHDAQRSAPLAQRLLAEGVLRNPPIVVPIEGDERYVVLDGANRVTAFEHLGLPHIAVQVVDYSQPELLLDSWHHLVVGLDCAAFAQTLQQLPGVSVQSTTLLHARAQLARREALAFVVHADHEVCTVRATGSLHERVARLNDMVDLYRSDGRIFRVSTDRLDELMPRYDGVTALVVFVRHDPSEIIELARIGALLPAGITRHVIPRRALRIDLPIDVLREPLSLADKNTLLHDWMKAKVARKQVRYYQESTFMFDE